ncbi:mechanosensitive ion channel family protein [Maribacter polysaccharolyticus]|uniref:mechanosensitive ion channel family protein n=1 Tax=Maribacter polysaccharolyticus TaxID=3020831 RepID=UPI00237EF817|nr:mechanosensitive ion channel domain-containing protein [Maribacter polysaccharolyticus]MDE3741451.1 mechanosensitive ion channel [Maribacter polysaccharolyticus]
MKTLKVYEENIVKAQEWLWDILPGLITALVTATIILIVGLWVIKLINGMVKRFFRKTEYDPSLETFLQSFLNIGLKLMLFVLVVTQLGVQSSSLVAVIGAAGLAIGLALQGSLANFAGGVLILVFKPFKVGDFIAAQGVEGTVKEITIFTTKLSTFGNQIAIVPNGQLSNNNIVNYNAQNTRRDKISVGIGYGSNIKQAKDILLQICAENENILKDPAPEVYVAELADSSVNLSLRFWAENEVFWAAHFHVMEELKNRFDAAGIEIPFPQRVIHQG